ncbi:hypothetical protein GCM10023219_20880 [Stakelama sediminis]|uniref:DUF3800 domain-containing protein n=1 Tax=Stakelama sediminis TaxID=463200 RepID=A0A840Z1T5_9SPHN|nr:DUF3800 domain-containing protein [Stakelama sediminis]MBB5719958.1 hypothetical protein [Stakelama sediminis]
MAGQVSSEYYIDESGNTGDLSAVRMEAYFTEQRMFALAAFGGSLDEAFTEEFSNLKSVHRLQGPEVKSKQAYERPRFILDLIDLLEAGRCPIFIEIVDKHYFVVVNIIERMVVPYVGKCDTRPDALWMKGVMADHMALYAPPELTHAFAGCCQSRDHTEIRNLYKRIIAWAEGDQASPEISEGISRFTRDSLKDFRKLPKAKAVERALPVPDVNPGGKLLWVLPNMTSFTHLYARINRYTRKQVSGVTLFHDEQLQFGDILQYAKTQTEKFAELDLSLPMQTADFDFSQAAELQFLRSHDSIGIQIADVLAGFIARYVQDAIWSGAAMHADKVAIFDRLVALGDRSHGTGVNFVAPDNLVRFLGVAPKPNY